MKTRFEEIDWRVTPMGDLSLRRRREPVLDVDVYEIKLGDDFLMSSLFTAGRRWHAILVDIDHSPRHLLHPRHAGLYQPSGLRRVCDRLHPGGVFGLWSNDPPDDAFSSVLAEVFAKSAAHVVGVVVPSL